MRNSNNNPHRYFQRSVGVSLLALALIGVVSPVDVMAQTTDGGSAARDTLEEVVVTARRRDESLEKVPIAISVIGAKQLIERQVLSDADLQVAVPGLTIRETQGNNSLTYSIRGQSADTFSGSPSAVVTYFNEVPLTVAGASTFYDLQSIQVLKGPQGTLFGRNTTGGAVLFTPAKPTNKLEALLRTRIGNFDRREVEAMINVPIVDDKVLFRASFDGLKRDGYIQDLYTGDELGALDRKSGRVSLTVLPVDRLTNTTVFQYSHVGGTNTGASYTYSVYQCGQTNNGVPLTCGSGLLFSPALDSVTGPGSWAAYLAAHPKAYAPGLPAYVAEQKRIGPYKTRHPGGADHWGRNWVLTNTTSYELNDAVQLKNILGVSHVQTNSQQPQLGAPFVTIQTTNFATGLSGNRLDVESFSDEAQLQGTALDGDLTYIVGYFFQRQRTDTTWPQTYFDVSPIIPPSSVTNAFRIRNDTKAVYAQSSYNIGSLIGVDNLRFTTGVRYTWEHVQIERLPLSPYFGLATDQNTTFSDPSWDVGLEWEATQDLMLYIKTRGSFRSGGYNGSAPPPSVASYSDNKFKSEHVKDVEGGLKYGGLVFERPATLNIAVYKQWIHDVQRVEFPDPDGSGPLTSIAVTANVPSANVWGIELEGSIMPASWLEVGLTFAYTDATFTNGKVTLFGTGYDYGPFGDTPERSGVVYAQVDFPTSPRVGEVTLRGEVYGQTSQYFSNAANTVAPGTKLPSYHLYNARLSWGHIFGSDFSAALFGKNLMDQEYFVGGMPLASALGHNAADVGEPRTYGMELTYKY